MSQLPCWHGAGSEDLQDLLLPLPFFPAYILNTELSGFPVEELLEREQRFISKSKCNPRV